MSTVHCYTSFTYSYLSRARILAQTLKQAHPNWKIWALLTDEAPPELEKQIDLSDFDFVIYSKELGFESYYSWIFKHNIVEACTAVKGQMLHYLLKKGITKVVYLDPDIGVFHPLTDIENKLDEASIILTPHQVEPNLTESSVIDNEITSMKYGIFNLGFVAVRNDTNGNKFAKWWSQQLYRNCVDDVQNGIFTDQKYCDLVPALFDGVFIERDPGCNVASWNLSRRYIEISMNGNIYVNGSPLKFYHFTKIGGAGDIMTDRYARDNIEVYELWNWYKRALASNQVYGLPKNWWSYGAFKNGEKITTRIRKFYCSRPDLIAFFKNPFVVDDNCLYDWLKREASHVFS